MITPFIRDEARLRSAALFPPPPSLSVRLRRRSTPCGMAHKGSEKRGKGPTLDRSDVGCGAKSGPRFFHPKGLYYVWRFRSRSLSLINKTSHPFALIPQAAHTQECATQGKSYKRQFLHVCKQRGLGKKFLCFLFFISAGAWRSNSASLP